MDARELGGDSNNKELGVKKGAWSSQEDSLLINYIAINGEGRWNHVARLSGLRRTGKSCRFRWINYLRPNVRRGNFTLEEQHRIMELHCFYGNRWSKIALFLPGRTDNEIKNYWRSRVVKQAKQLKYDINSVELREFIRDVCLPRLSEYIHASSQFNNNNYNNNNNHNNIGNVMMNYDVTENIGPDALEVHQRATWSNVISSEVHEGPSSCGFYNPTSFDENLGQQYYGVDGYGFHFQGSGSPVWFSCGEISNLYVAKGNT